MNDSQPDISRTEEPLGSWKEIGAYLQRNAATVRRWEKEEGLPVHRHPHKSRSSVYAYPSEIDAWRASRKLAVERTPAPLWRRVLTPAFMLTMASCLIMVGNGVRPQVALAQQTARQVWTAPVPAGLFFYASISPDGRYLSFADGDPGDLAVHDLVTGATRRLTNREESNGFAENSVISADSRQVAYAWFGKNVQFSLRILPLNAASATPRIIYQSDGADYEIPFAWTPDGKQLLVRHHLKDRATQIALVSIQDGSTRVLKSFSWQYPRGSLSPDGRYIAYDFPASDAAPARDIFVLAVDGSRETVAVQHPANDFSPLWSPDGSRILFLSDRTGNVSLWSVPIDRGRPAGPAELVKANVGPISPLGVSKNGTLFYVSDGGGRNVYVAELDADMRVAKPPVLVTERFVNSNGQPSWSPDGQYLAYYSYRGPRGSSGSTTLVIRSLHTGEERDIPSHFQLPPPDFVAAPKWFPDGRSVLAVMRDPQRPGSGYYRVDLASGNAELLHRVQWGGNGANFRPDLSPDGKTIFYADNDGSQIGTRRLMRFDIESRREKELKHTPPGWVMSLAVSPDGTQLALLVGDGQGCSVQIIPAAGGESREVFRATPWEDARFGNLAWTPDQRYVLFANRENERDGKQLLWRVPAAGGTPEKIGLSMGTIMSPRVHPDGRRIVFESLEPGLPEVWALENFLHKTAAAR